MTGGSQKAFQEQARTSAVSVDEREPMRFGERHCRALLDGAGLSIGFYDHRGTCLYLNRKACELMKGSLSDFAGRGVVDLFGERMGRLILERISKVLAQNQPVVFEDELDLPSVRAWFSSTYTPIANDQDAIEGVQIISQNISDRKLADASLRGSERRVTSILQAAPIGIAVLEDRIMLDANDRFCKLTGYAREEFIGKTPRMFYLKNEEYERVGREHYEELRRYGTGTTEIQLRRRDGRILTVLLSSALLNPADPSAGVTCTLLDITPRKEAVEALKESRRRLSTLLSNLPGMAYRCGNDPDWTMEFVSEGSFDLTGLTPRELTGTQGTMYNHLIVPDDRPHVWDQIQNAIARCSPFELTYRIRTTTDQEKWVWEQGRAIFDNSGDVVALEGFITDITDKKHAEQERERLQLQIRQAQKMEAIGQLTGGVAHDFNNLLQAILGYTELAQDSLAPDSRAAESLAQVSHASERAAELVSQLLMFSRQQAMHPENIDLNEAISGTLKMLRRVIGEDIQLRWHPFAGLTHIRADKGMVDQVLMNLCVNARDAMPDGGALTIKTEYCFIGDDYLLTHAWATPGSYVLMTVSDTGEGMNRETQDHIFEPFFTTKKLGKGTGLGLATVYGIVKQHGGMINVYSEPGTGTVFRTYWPVSETTPEPSFESDVLSDTRGNETILIAEDDDNVRDLSQTILEQAGYKVIVARDGEEAVELFKRNAPEVDLVMLDLIMPRKGGREACEAMRSEQPNLNVVFASGYSDDEIRSRFITDQGYKLVQKPYTRRELLKAVRNTLDGTA